MKRLAIAIALILMMCAPTFAQTVGLVQNSISATYVAGDGAACKSLLVTGQFLAATPGYQLTVKKVSPQVTPTIHELELVAAPPTGNVIQVLTLMPVNYSDPGFTSCPYGVSITYGKQKGRCGPDACVNGRRKIAHWQISSIARFVVTIALLSATDLTDLVEGVGTHTQSM